MKRSVIPVFVAAILFLAEANAFASSTERTDELLWQCEGKQPTVAAAWIGQLSCARYIDGILDMHSIMTGGANAALPLFCLPSRGVSVDQAMKIFVKWANNNPEKLHTTARISVVLAMSRSFPCR